MRSRSTSARFLGLLAAATLTAAGCSSVSPDAESSGSLPAGPEAESPTDLALTDDKPSDNAPDEVQALDVTDFTIGLVRPTTWAPSQVASADQGAVIVADLLYDGLTEVVGSTGTLRPALASSWSANENLTEWTFELDPSRVDAATVVASFNNLLATPGLANEVLVGDIQSIVEIDSDTVIITTSEPAAGLPWRLSGVGASVVGPEGSTTGQYRIEADSEQETLLIASTGSIALQWASTPEEAFAWLSEGAVDAAIVDESSLEDAVDRFGADLPARNVTQMLVLNTRSSNLSSDAARQAIVATLDRDDLASVIGERSYPGDGVAGPSIAGFASGTCGTACGGDAGSFAAILNGAPLSTLSLGYASPHQQELAESIVGQLFDVGVTVDAVQLSPEELANQLISGQLDLAISGWVLPASSLDAAVPALFDETSATNSSGAVNAEIDTLLAEAATTADDQARWAILNQAQTRAIELGFVAPLGYGKSRLVTVSDGDQLVQRADGSIDLAQP